MAQPDMTITLIEKQAGVGKCGNRAARGSWLRTLATIRSQPTIMAPPKRRRWGKRP